MRSITAAVITTACLTAALGGSVAADAAFADKSHVLQLTAETEQFAVVDVGTPGPALGLGDQIVSSDKVFRNGKAVGTDGVVCTVVKATADALTCQWVMTISLPEGQLALQAIADGPTGPPTEPTKVTFAVTGGTGQFRDAHGIADIVDNTGGSEQITVRLSR
jgi:hypothetical protein